MPLSIDIRVQGNQIIQREFAAWRHHAKVTRPYFSMVRADFRKMMLDQFDSEGGRLSGGWAPLKESTIRRKAGRYDSRILHRTRRMRTSFTTGRGGYRYVNSRTMKIGSDVPYVGYHQAGTARMVARPIFEMTPEIANRWTQMFAQHMVSRAPLRSVNL